VLQKLKGGVMSPTAELIETFCPKCGEVYAHWERQTLESFLPPSCPQCGHDPATDRVFLEDGLWTLTADEEETAER
jgi:hypothetical protein